MENQNPKQQQSPIAETPVSQTPPISSPPQTPPVVKKASKFSIKAIIGTIIFLLLAGGAAAGYVYREPLMKLVSNPTPTPSPFPATITPTPDPTVDWKTYEGDGFSFKYPLDAKVEEVKVLNQVLIYPIKRDEYRNSPDYGTKLYKLIYHIGITTIDNPTNLTVIEHIEKGLQDLEKQTEPGPSEAKAARQSIKEREINGIMATSIIQGHAGKTESLYIAKGNKIYRIGISGDEYEPFPEVMETVNQILSTFKFTDSNKIDTSNWKTYTNAQFGLTIKYPPQLPLFDENTPSQTGEKGFTTVHFTNPPQEPGIGPVDGVWIRMYDNSVNEQYLQQQKKEYEGLMSLSIGQKKQIGGMEFTRLANDTKYPDAYVFEEKAVPNYPAETVPYVKGYVFKKSNGLVYVSVIPKTESSTDTHLSTFTQMLTTLKFTD